jgi:hypothetical protein
MMVCAIISYPAGLLSPGGQEVNRYLEMWYASMG